MVLGSCLCNAVQFKVTGDFKRIVNCHCNLCRKMNGAAFFNLRCSTADRL